MKQLTIRLDDELERRVQALARAEGISLNKAVLRLIWRGVTPGGRATRAVGTSLDHLRQLTDEEADQIDKAVEQVCESIDDSLWK